MKHNFAVHQVLPNMEYGDAITNYALLLQSTLRRLGYKSNIYAQYIHSKLRKRTNPIASVARLQSEENIVWFYHYSIQSDITNLMRTMRGRVVLLYHNITPPDLSVGGGENFISSKLYVGLQDLKSFTDIPKLAVGSSNYNRDQLKSVGFRRTEIMPIILNYELFDRQPSRVLMQIYDDDMVNFITVSRIYPHKKIEDIIRVFYYYHNLINPRSRLIIIGDPKGMEWYYDQLIGLQHKLDLSNIVFTGRVRFRELIAYYKLADIFLLMSEHEGFGVPLLECMYLGVPIIAYNCSAVSETLDDAGVLVNKKKCGEIAELAQLLLSDNDLRTRVINKQKDRALYFQPDALVSRLQKILTIATLS